MTKEQILDDLNYATEIARSGKEAPLLGGPIGLMWGILLMLIFSGQFIILEKIWPIAPKFLIYMWIAFAVIGSFGSFLLGHKIETKVGANSTANKVEGYVWIMFAGLMASLALGVILNQVFNEGTHRLWDLIVVVGFAGQGLAYGVIAKLTGEKWLHATAFLSFMLSAICFSVYGNNTIYLIAAIGTIGSIIIPSFISMRKAA